MMDTIAPHSLPLQLLWIPWIHTLSPSMMISPMSPHSVPLIDDGSHGSLQTVPPQLLCLRRDEEGVARELTLHKGMTGLVGI